MVALARHSELTQRVPPGRRPPPTREPSRENFTEPSPSDQQAQRDSLIAIAADGPVHEACAVANRSDLDEKHIEILARRPEREVAHALAHNGSAKLGRKNLRTLMERGREDAKLAQALLRREDLHLCHFRLFLNADGEQRGHLIAIARLSRLDRTNGAELYPEPDAANVARLERAALAGNLAAFDRTLAEALPCDLSMAKRISSDRGGEALALALAALGVPHEKAAGIFLAGFPELSSSSQKLRPLMRIVYSVPRRTAARLTRAITGRVDVKI